MLIWGGGRIVGEVVNDHGVAVGREVDVELEEEGGDRRGCARVGTQRQEDVPAGVGEVEESLGGERRAIAF